MNKILKISKLNNTGDTIVEVLIAIVAIGGVLSGAYLSIISSSQYIQISQQREEAINLAQNQIEMMKTVPSLLTNISSTGCFYLSTTNVMFDASGSNCDKGNINATTVVTNKSTPTNGNLNVYEIKVSWTGSNGNTEIVTLFYQPST